MDTSHDRVALTAEERRIVAVLEKASGHHRRLFRLSTGIAARAAGLRSRRMGGSGAVLLLVAGASLMVATFTRWPAVAVVGVGMQAGALWWGLTRLARRVGAWTSAKKARAGSDQRSTRPDDDRRRRRRQG